MVGHRLQLNGWVKDSKSSNCNNMSNADLWKHELSEIQDCFSGSRKKLDFITVPFSELCDSSDLFNCDIEVSG